MKTKILVATHKACKTPDNTTYQPIQVGKILSNDDFGYLSDDTGENISEKNRNYSELTALYRAWKNNYFSDAEYCGLVHYRRYFAGELPFGRFSILSEEEISNYMKQYDIILPKKRNYYIETIESHYAHAHYKSDLDECRKIVAERYPDYLGSFDAIMKQKKLHLYNMFVMPKEYFDDYMHWLFDILFPLEKRIDTSMYDSYQGRVFGFLSERLFNVWVLHNRSRVKELKVVNTEGENLLLKAVEMIKRKFMQ